LRLSSTALKHQLGDTQAKATKFEKKAQFAEAANKTLPDLRQKIDEQSARIRELQSTLAETQRQVQDIEVYSP